MRLLRWVTLACVLSIASSAEAAPRVSLAPLPGSPKPGLVPQLRREICGAFRCVPWSRVSTAGAPDPAKARRAGVAGTVVGIVGRQGGRRVLALSLFTDARFAAVTWRLPLDRRGMVAPEDLAAVVRELSVRLGATPAAAHPPGREVPAPPPPRAAPREPPEEETAVPPPPRAEANPPSTGVSGMAQAPPGEVGAPPPSPPPRSLPPPSPTPTPSAPREPRLSSRPARPESARWLALDVGALGGRRELRFRGAAPAPAPLRDHVVPAFAGPIARVEIHPGALVTDGALAGIGLFAAYASSLGIETRVDGEAHETRLWRLSAGAAWRTAPLGARRTAVTFTASYEQRHASVRPAIAGLPDAHLAGVRGGAGLELPLGRSFSLIASGAYVRWLTARDLVDPGGSFFPGGAAWALEVEAGVSVALSPWLSVIVSGEGASTRYTLDRDPEGIHRARAASDDLLLARIAARLIL